MHLFFDTETTGLPDMKMPIEWEGQPHIAQIGAILTDEAGVVRGEMNVIIKPDGYEIPEGASRVHGITTDIAHKYGVDIRGALYMFAGLARMAEKIVAHNIGFDVFLIQAAHYRSGVRGDYLMGKERFCTMESSRNVCCIPPTERMLAAGFTQYKSPNLTEAFQHFFGVPFDGAHDAMADVRACRDIFYKLNGAV